jgi:riboflavin biosynthesis pyrimidine reductase
MTRQVVRLYPPSAADPLQPLAGLYLAHKLHELGAPGKPFVYGNFITSLDGRIALADDNGASFVPPSLSNTADWLLFQELQAQADCFVTHGGYLRALAAGALDDILQIGTRDDSAHLLQWRKAQGLVQQPGVVVVSSSLNFPIPASVKKHRQRFYIVTTEAADRTRAKIWRDKGFELIFAGKGELVEGKPLGDALVELGFRSVYLQAGPLLLGALLGAGLLNRLYLTLSHQIIGGEVFHTMIASAPLGQAGQLKLRLLYLDEQTDRRSGQFFACFEPF